MTEDTLKDGIHLDDAKSQEQQTLLLQQLSTYIEELPPRYKEIFILSFVKEMKNGEVAEALGISINTVKVVKQKVKNRLKERTMSFLSSSVILSRPRRKRDTSASET